MFLQYLTLSSLQVSSGFKIGTYTIHWYGLLIAASIMIAYQISTRRASHYQIQAQYLDPIFTWALILGIVGARLYHVFSEWTYYQSHLGQIIAIWQGGIGIYGGLLGGLLGIYLACRFNNISYPSALNLVAPSVALSQAISRWGNFFNQEAFGPPTDLPWKIFIIPANRPLDYINAEYFHPVFLYESILNFVAAILLFIHARYTGYKGSTSGLYLIFYGIIRLITEPFRFDTAMISGIKVAYIISLAFIIAGLYLIHRQRTLDLLKFPRPQK